MTLRQFLTGHDLPGVRKPGRQDFYFVGSSLLMIAIVLGIVVTVYRWWGMLVSNSYFPAPLVLLAATAIYLAWYWLRVWRELDRLYAAGQERSSDPLFVQIITRARITLYRGFFITCMLVLLMMMTLHLLIR